MPSEHTYQLHPAPPPLPYAPSQHKSCPSCYALVLVPEFDAPATCPNCREQVLLRAAQAQNNSARHLRDQDFVFAPCDPPSNLHATRPALIPVLRSPPTSPVPPPSPLPAVSPPRLESHTEFIKPYTAHITQPPEGKTPLPTTIHSPAPILCQPHSPEPHDRHPAAAVASYIPDPLSDITRIRMRTRANRCLYPGATFQGTQKSGRNSYDVTVTIVSSLRVFGNDKDVDFATSFLCGYLCIRGLTDDWPELTTYFDAEIIGSRHGFLTQNWGASENEDLVHWSRFPAFRQIKHEAKRPRLTIDDRDRGAVFMRWKEKFLVPDHRVHDINGASFAGFYYVCVDFNPAATASSNTVCDVVTDDERSGRKQQRTRRGSNTKKTSVTRSPASPVPYTAPVATMSGFYYHQNSEPYQQLSLSHVPETCSSSFEFR